MVADPAAVRAEARRAAALAQQLREDGARVADLAQVAWQSTEAERWRQELAEAVASVHRDAEAVDAVADALVAHAEACERTLAAIASARAAFFTQVDEARRVLANAAEGASSLAVSSARAILERSVRAPGPASIDWLRF
jgi:hypothetical protein